jgi:hypothetical protein
MQGLLLPVRDAIHTYTVSIVQRGVSIYIYIYTPIYIPVKHAIHTYPVCIHLTSGNVYNTHTHTLPVR